MSEYENAHDDIPRFDPWLRVMAGSVLPVVVALYLPSQYLVPLIIATVVLFVAGLVMLRRQTVQRRQDREQREPSRRAVARSLKEQGLEMEGAES